MIFAIFMTNFFVTFHVESSITKSLLLPMSCLNTQHPNSSQAQLTYAQLEQGQCMQQVQQIQNVTQNQISFISSLLEQVGLYRPFFFFIQKIAKTVRGEIKYVC